jgi:hypothetical protein
MQNETVRIKAPGSNPSGGIAPHGEASTLNGSGTASAMANGSDSSLSRPIAGKDASRGGMDVQWLMMMTRQWEADGACLLRPAIHPAWPSDTILYW